MEHIKVRDYTKVLNRINLALKDNYKLDTLGYIKNSNHIYPFNKLTLGKNKTKRVLISAGIHGDEPAGVETVCAFLESGLYKPFLNLLEIIILPCINPYGYEFNTRENHAQIDLNRMFKVTTPPIEVKLTQSVFKKNYFNISLELHEDFESHGFYLFQKSNKPFGMELGHKIIESVKTVLPINLESIIDVNPAENGLIHRIKDIGDMKWWPMAGYSLEKKTGHCFTFETPMNYSLQTRVEANLIAIKKALIECVTIN